MIRRVVGTISVAGLLFGVACGEVSAPDDGEEATFSFQEDADGSPAGVGRCESDGEGWDCPFECDDPDTWPESWHRRAERLVDKINDVRSAGAECSGEEMAPVVRLEYDRKLAEAARCHGLDMGENGFFAHEGSDGSDEAERARNAGYESDYVGENIAVGQRQARAVVDAWLDSPGHCVNLMHSEYRDVGVAFVEVGDRAYWVQKNGRVW